MNRYGDAAEVNVEGMDGKFLSFTINDEDYAVPIEYVTEIVRHVQVTPVPDFPSYLDGITNLRGRIVPIMNLRKRLGLPVVEFTDKTCTMILNIKNHDIGIIVDSVAEVLSIPVENISEPPMGENAVTAYVGGIAKINDKIKLVLDCEAVVAR